MRRPVPSLLLAAVLTAILAVSGPGPAAAKPYPDHVSVKDKAGDAPARVDLLSGTYAISNGTARWSAKVEDLTETTFFAFEIWPLAAAWDRVAVYREDGRTVGKVYFVDNEESPTPYVRQCPRLKVSWKFAKNRVSVQVPRHCLQASKSNGSAPYEFHAYSRIGGQKHGPRDALPAKTLDR